MPNNGGVSVTSFQIDANGALAFADTEPTGGTGVVYSAVTADGRRLYVNNWFSNTIAGYDVGAGGALTPITGSPFPAGANTNPMGLRPSLNGQRLYAALIHDSAEQIGVYAIAGNGALSAVPGGAVASGVMDPTFPVQTPDGRRLYAAAITGGANTPGFNIADTGALTPIPGSPFISGVGGGNFQSLAVTPNQGPTAALAVNVTNRDARTAEFDASASTDADGSIATYAFNFGDGETQTGRRPPQATPTRPRRLHGDRHGHRQRGLLDRLPGHRADGLMQRRAEGDRPGRRRCDTHAPAGPPAVPDTDPPGLTVSGRRKQELGSSVFVKAACDEPCTATATGKLNVKSPGAGKQTVRFKLKPKTKALAAGATTKLKLKIPRKARRGRPGAARGGRPRRRSRSAPRTRPATRPAASGPVRLTG